MIYIDSAEKPYMRSAFDDLGIIYKSEHLESSDYTDKKTFVCEYKSSNDFVQSVSNGRVFKQCNDLLINDYKVKTVYIGCRGLFDLCISNNNKYMTVNNLIGAITTIQHMGISVIFVDTPKTLAKYVQSLESKSNSEIKEHSPIRRKVKSGDFKLDIIRGIPGVGPAAGKLLLKEFGTIRAIADVEQNELVKIKGIGKVSAKNIYESLN